MVASIVEYESPCASIRITRARRASSDRILRLRTRRSSSVRSSVVNVSAIWRQRVPVLLQAVQATSIEVNRRARRAKTDRMDVEKLLGMLLRYVGGEQTGLADRARAER